VGSSTSLKNSALRGQFGLQTSLDSSYTARQPLRASEQLGLKTLLCPPACTQSELRCLSFDGGRATIQQRGLLLATGGTTISPQAYEPHLGSTALRPSRPQPYVPVANLYAPRPMFCGPRQQTLGLR
jgi:hypothetical protein